MSYSTKTKLAFSLGGRANRCQVQQKSASGNDRNTNKKQPAAEEQTVKSLNKEGQHFSPSTLKETMSVHWDLAGTFYMKSSCMRYIKLPQTKLVL
jgi:hypothetical protein